MKKRLMFYCQHVLGMGHFIRSTEIVRGLNGFDVSFLNGGEIVQGFELPASVNVINLPPIKSDVEFRDIHAANGLQSLEQTKAIRTSRILAEYERWQPDVLMIELFPFGRRKFEFELLPLLERIKATNRQTKVVCSLRDILVSKRDQSRYETRVVELVNEYFDLLLIHADPRFQRLEETFPSASELRCAVQYTGFVAGTVPRAVASLPRYHQLTPTPDTLATARGVPTILVSIGGGRVGAELLDCAMEASQLLADQLPHRMLVFTGPYISDSEFAALQTKASERVTVERYTTNFLAYLAESDLSISMAGYNTCMNLLATGTRAIVYPFTGNNNEEQTIRAEKLAQLGILDVLYAHELSPEILAKKIVQQLNTKPAATPLLDLRGVEKTAQLLGALAHSQHSMEVAA